MSWWAMPHRARRCAACGQLYHGAPWSRLCDGCRAERRKMSDFNLPEECCDYGMCELKLSKAPKDFADWYGAMVYMDGARVDMQEDFCGRWEACE